MTTPQLDLLLKEIKDPYVQENFYKLKSYINNLKTSIGTGGTGPQGVPGPAGAQGPAGISDFFTKISSSVSSVTTKIIDTVPMTDFRMLEYTLRASNSPNTKTRGLKMIVKVTDTTITDQVSSRIGDSLNMGISASISGSNVILSLQNFEAFQINYVLIRATL